MALEKHFSAKYERDDVVCLAFEAAGNYFSGPRRNVAAGANTTD